jgi:predicted permease
MAQFRAKEITLTDGRRGQSEIHTGARTPLLLLFGITGIVLLSTCANIANLLLARGASRTMEMAVRLSLGASRPHILTQLLTESCVLALLGGAASLLVAQWTLAGIAAVLPPEASAMLRLDIQPAVVLFAAVLSLGTGLLFGLFPALHSTRPALVNTIRANAGQIVGARSANRFRSVLVTSQIALSMMLLISAGLFLRSLMNVSRVDLGLQVDQVVTFAISPELNGYEPARSRVLFERVEEELATLPGVTGVSASLVPLLAGSNWANDVSVEGYTRIPGSDPNARYNAVGANYFRTLGTPLLTGREFTPADRLGAPKVAIVNQAFADKFGLGREAVGKRMGIGDGEMDLQIVGVIQNTKYSDVKDEAPPLFATPYRQRENAGSLTFYVRTAGNPQLLVRSIPGVIARLDPNLPVEELKTMAQQVRENVFMDRMVSTLSSAFAVLATLLAAVGLYGVLAYTVTMRTREIGVRIALGAGGGHVRGLVLRQVGWMMLVGGAIGIVAALGLGRAASSLLFGLEGNDPTVVASAAMLLALVGFAAGLIPALRASRIDPMQALRAE